MHGRTRSDSHAPRPWTFVVVTDRALLEQLAVHDWMRCARGGAGYRVAFLAEDGSAAVQNRLVAATALGYGSCWLQGRTERHIGEIKTLLKIPADRHLMTLIPLGVPAESPRKEKKALDEVLH